MASIIKEETSDFTEDDNHQIEKACTSKKCNNSSKKHIHKHHPSEEEKCDFSSSAGFDKDNFLNKFKKLIPEEKIHKEIISNSNI